MEINSRYCELSTYAASSGYNSSTASSSLNYIDVENLTAVIDNQCDLIVDKNNNNNSSESSDIDLESKPIKTTVIITITLVKKEQLTANGTAQQYYNPIAGYSTNQASAANQLYPTMNHQPAQQLSHSPSPPNSSSNNNNNNNNNNAINNNNYQNNERAQRQYNKLMRKLETRNMSTQAHSQTSRNNKNDNLNGTSGTRRNLQRNGTSTTTSGGGASSVGTSDDGEESSSVPDEEDDMHILIDYLSSIEPPTVKEIQSHTALITWEPPPQPTENALVNLNTNDIRYEILLGDRGKDGKYKSIFRGTNLSCRIQDLRAGQEYHVCLSSHLLDGIKGSETEPVVFKTPAREPDQPGQPKVLSKTKNSIQLRWNAPADNGSHIVHYILEMSTDPDGEFTEVCKTKGKQFSVPKLAPATWYAFRLAAVNDCGRSEFSQPISYNTDGYPPPQPQAPRVHNLTTASITLLWNRRREDGDFILQMSTQGSGYMNVYYGPEIINECTRLQRATSYQFRLASKTEAGQSPWSEEITVNTLPEQPGRPSKPQTKGKIHAYNFKVKWDPPHDRGGAEIKLYHLEISSGAVFERIYSGNQAEAVCERLTPGTTYQVRVLCEGPGGISAPSDTSTLTTEAIVPNAPKTPYYSNLPGPYAAVLQWEKPHYQGGAPVTEYELELEGILNDGVEKKKQRTIVYRGKEPYCVVKDLLPGESYTTHVRAVNRIGAGEWSDEFSFRSGSAPPSKPLSPEVQVRSATNLCVKWQEPQCNGAPILDYKLESSSNQEEDAFTVVYHGTETSADLKDLLPFTTYYFRLHAVNASGRSPNSPTVSQKTPAAVPAIPSLLPDLFVITSNAAHFYWREPECNGDSIISYVLECGDRQIATETNQTDLLVEHLNPEQIFKVRVQAVNSIGAGAFCLSHKITTKPLPPKSPRLECIQFGYNSLKLKWGNEGSPASSKGIANVMDFQRFYVEMKIKSSSKDFQNIYTGTRNSIKVQKLHESTDYAFRICAQTEHAGMGAWSDEYCFRTHAAQPNSVKIVRCIESFPVINSNVNEPHAVDTATPPSLTVEWQHSKNNHFNDSIEYILQKAFATNINSKNLQYDEIYRGSDTRFTDTVEYDTDYSLRVIPVRVMKSKRTTSVCSSSTRNSHDDSDEVDGRHSSDESEDESDDETKERINDTPITYEYVYGTASPAYHTKLPKSAADQQSNPNASAATTTIISSQSTVGTSRKTSKANSAKSTQLQTTASKKHHNVQQSHKLMEVEASTPDSSDDEKSTKDVASANPSLFLNLLKVIREFFVNRNNWSVTEESIIIWFGFMFFAIVVGCILHFLMA